VIVVNSAAAAAAFKRAFDVKFSNGGPLPKTNQLRASLAIIWNLRARPQQRLNLIIC
jgi:hypothetical protein